MKKSIFIVIALLSYSFMALADDVSSDLGNFFEHLGFLENVTAGSAYQSQAAGYYSAGSIFLRNGVKNIQLFQLSAPTIRSGCGGIDLFAGGFSFIDSDALVGFFQSIMKSAGGYALNLALETEVPEIAHAMQYIQQIAQKVNDMNLNSCDMAEDLVGGLWPKTRASQQQICQDIGSQNNFFSDWAAARQGCSTGNDFPTQIDKAAHDDKYQNRVMFNKNLIWEALKQTGFKGELAEFFMSLSGTIIYNKNGKVTILYPLTNKHDLSKALLYGGEAKIYVCDEPDQCLQPKSEDITIATNKSLNQQVIGIITSLVLAVKNNDAITELQRGFLNTVSIPVLKFIIVSLSLGSGSQALDLTSYSDLIAKDLLKQYLIEAVQIVEQSITTATDYTPEVKKQLEDAIQKSLINIQAIKTNSHEDLQDAMTLIQSVRTLETQATSLMSDQFKENLRFGGAS